MVVKINYLAVFYFLLRLNSNYAMDMIKIEQNSSDSQAGGNPVCRHTAVLRFMIDKGGNPAYFKKYVDLQARQKQAATRKTDNPNLRHMIDKGGNPAYSSIRLSQNTRQKQPATRKTDNYNS